MKKKKWNVTWEHFSTLSSTPSHLFAMLRCCVVMSSPNRLSIIPALQRESSRTLWAGRETRSSWGWDSAREVWECRKYRRWRATDGVANGRYMSDDDSGIGTLFREMEDKFFEIRSRNNQNPKISWRNKFRPCIISEFLLPPELTDSVHLLASCAGQEGRRCRAARRAEIGKLA